MKVLLITCPYSEKQPEIIFPLGLAYIAASIEEHDVCLFDPNVYDNPQDEAISIIKSIEPDVIGISLRNIEYFSLYTKIGNKVSYLPDLSQFLNNINAINSNAKIVMGGAAFTLFPLELMKKFEKIDVGICGEGEISFNQYLHNINAPEKVKGLYIRADKEVFYTGQPDIQVNLDTLKISKTLSQLDLEKYKQVGAVGIQTARGCAFKCSYCTYFLLEGKSVRTRSPEKVADEIEHLHRNFGIKHIEFTDAIFNVPRSHALNICKAITNRKLDIKLSGAVRVDHINEEFLQAMIAAGFVYIDYSFDALSQKGLDDLNKRVSTKAILTAFRLLKKSNIIAYSNIFLDVSCQDIRTTIETCINILKIKFIVGKQCKMFFSRLRIYPNTPIYQIALNQKMISSNNDLFYPTFYKSSLFSKLLYSLLSGKML